MCISLKVVPLTSCIGFLELDVLVDGLRVLPSGNSIANRLSVEVTLVRPPSTAHYPQFPLMYAPLMPENPAYMTIKAVAQRTART
ncbi:hypothetical protein A9G42_06565 [Gilliamella sp. Nev6-6]|nr:hypothetical protein A9G42_06565 [Gilliamella apicola]